MATTERLAVLMPGLGAVATTFMAGVELARRGARVPVGSLTQLGKISPGRDAAPVPLGELLPLAPLDGVVFGAWDIVSEDAGAVAARSRVLAPPDLADVRDFLREIVPRPGVHDPATVRRIAADHVMSAAGHRARVEALRQDIRAFRARLGAARAVVVFTASTEVYRPAPRAGASLAALERALDAADPEVTPTMLYAYAALAEGVPFANATPNRSIDLPAFIELAVERGVPTAGKDLKSGQTFMKTALAPALRARLLGLNGWFSTNILGNRDGEVLDDPAAFRSKEVTKTGVLETILDGREHPELYARYSNKVSIHYYPPRGDDKEGWDNLDIFGWLGYPMQIKVNFLCRDSILAAPLVLDVALLLDVAARAGRAGLQEWLSFYFKSPAVRLSRQPVHDLFRQEDMLQRELRAIAEELDARSSLRPTGTD